VAGLFARFAGIFLGPEPQGTRHVTEKNQNWSTTTTKLDLPLELSIGPKFTSTFAGSGK
jgi:hypothetical protein